MPSATKSPTGQMRLYDREGRRQYINAAERERFLSAVLSAPPEIRTFARTLLYTGCRISEALELVRAAVQVEDQIVTFRTLKRRDPFAYREVPIPAILAVDLNETHAISASSDGLTPLWCEDGKAVNRSTAYRWIKQLMLEAEICGVHASPKGLRHGFAVHAMRSGVPISLISKWLGHASLETTAIYLSVVGPEQREIATRMW